MNFLVLFSMLCLASADDAVRASLRGSGETSSRSHVPIPYINMSQSEDYRIARSAGVDPIGSPGDVDFLYTFGAPGFSNPPMKSSMGSSTCFTGRRVWTMQPGSHWGTWVDFAAIWARSLWWWHPEVNTLEYHVDDVQMSKTTTCSEDTNTGAPESGTPSVALHRSALYIALAQQYKEAFWQYLTIIATEGSYWDAHKAAENIKQFGWRMVNSARHPGQKVLGGPQVSHLFQHPETLECALTFQGSQSAQDFAANLYAPASHFCGLVEQDESCSRQKVCTPRDPKGSFVHMGIRDHFRRMVQHDSWQKNILPNLQFCSMLYITGHSLGGAVASMFASCLHRAPQVGQYGYEEDYKYVGFTQSTPKQLDYI